MKKIRNLLFQCFISKQVHQKIVATSHMEKWDFIQLKSQRLWLADNKQDFNEIHKDVI